MITPTESNPSEKGVEGRFKLDLAGSVSRYEVSFLIFPAGKIPYLALDYSILLLQHALTIGDSQLRFIRCDAMQNRDNHVSLDGATLNHQEAHRFLQ
jgi:hypothetical protein